MKFIQNTKYKFLFFLAIFFLINLLQSGYTSLLYDEAYYWMWSKDIAFGYFDHPPLVAVWIKISSLFFDGELGVRFFSSISFTLMIYVIWLLIDNKNKWDYVLEYFLIINGVALLNIYGFVTTPDTPLLLFVAIFLYAYKLFLVNNKWANTLFLGFSMAALMYSKYHGILIVIFVVISNFSLLKNKRFWFASLFGLLLFIPHIYWQYLNEFPSFKYHLIERGAKSYKISHTLMHFVNQIAIVGITFPVIYYAFYKQDTITKFERSLKIITYGFIIFFFFSTFSSRPQAQWTAVILIPLVVLSFPYIINHSKAKKWLVILSSIQLVILIIARILLSELNTSPLQLEPQLAKSWIPILKEKTNEKPIVFISSYRNASIYEFYTGIKSHSYSILEGRKSQYDLNNYEETMQGENLFAVSTPMIDSPNLVNIKRKSLNGVALDNFNTFQKVKCLIENEQLILTENKKVNFEFTFINTYSKDINFDHVRFYGIFQGKKNIVLNKSLMDIQNITPLRANETKVLKASFKAPKIDYKGDITFRVGIEFYDLLEGFQGNKVEIKYLD